MSRAKYFIIAFVYLFIYGLFTVSLGLGGDTGFSDVLQGVDMDASGALSFLANIWNVFKMIGSLAAFQIPNVPVIMVVLTIYPAIFVIIFLVVEFAISLLRG